MGGITAEGHKTSVSERTVPAGLNSGTGGFTFQTGRTLRGNKPLTLTSNLFNFSSSVVGLPFNY